MVDIGAAEGRGRRRQASTRVCRGRVASEEGWQGRDLPQSGDHQGAENGAAYAYEKN